MNPFAGLWTALRDAVRALKPHGDGPIVFVLISVTAIVSLAARAPGTETLLVDILGLGAFFLWSERKHIWKRRADEAEYDALEERETAAGRRRLRKKVKGSGKEGGRTIAPPKDDADV
ncbi:hypothetical protein Q8W71_31845 [Methylobacterium sp. NEAU 140]|uniref:hypothetical protein n=1 Tax=Methylobacterium sp. NEAU 140 TaxID=3064945 RepID=UPI0027332704|nr:hypothetical protein [Methylobacterium sp. NEAU 140]MDP4027173.1 hypothetical protein [Methylobacterium sp. NEAU 140]